MRQTSARLAALPKAHVSEALPVDLSPTYITEVEENVQIKSASASFMAELIVADGSCRSHNQTPDGLFSGLTLAGLRGIGRPFKP